MEHIYPNIEGWFDFHTFYNSVLDRLPQDYIFVEVGVWKGKSLSYFVIESINKSKNGKIYAVDHWLGSEEHQKDSWAYDPLTQIEDGLYNEYCKNIVPIRDYIFDIKNSSEVASNTFENQSIDAVFIDASHDYDNVYRDISSWYPKVKFGGIISGHDYDWPGVNSAVNNFAKAHNMGIVSYDNVWELLY